MKKKLGIVVSILLVMVMLVGTLLACTKPKEEIGKGKKPEATESIDAGSALTEIFGLWIENNSFKGGNTLGWDLGFDYTSEGKNGIGIDFKGGITNEDNNDAFELSVVKTIADKTSPLLSVIFNKDAAYLKTANVSLKLPELKLGDVVLGTGEASKINGTLSTVMGLLSLAGSMLDDHAGTVTTTENGGVYTKEYNVGLDIYGGLSDLREMLEKAIGKDLTETIFTVVQALFENNTIKFKAVVTGLVWEETTKEKDDKIFYTYEMTGGNLDVNSINAGLQIGKTAYHNVAITGLGVIGEVPAIAVPTDFVEKSILKHQIVGEFKMNSATTNVATYAYQLNVEFDASNILKTIQECVLANSPTPLVNKIFKDQKGKIYMNIDHTCADTGCVDHAEGKFDGSLFTIAYDSATAAFDNNRVHVAVHAGALLPAELFKKIGQPALAKYIPDEYLSISVDPVVFSDAHDARKPKAAKKSNTANVSTSVQAEEVAPIDFGAIVSEIFGAITNPKGILTIDYKTIYNVVINKLGLTEAVKKDISEVLELLFPEVEVMTLNAVYTNGASLDTEFNGKDMFMTKKGDVKKTFIVGDAKAFAPMKGVYSFVMQDKSVVINSGSIQNAGNVSGVSAEFPVSYEEYLGMGRKNTALKDVSTVTANYIDINKANVTEVMTIMEVIGLDKTIIGIPQTVSLVVAGNSGTSMFAFFNHIADAVKAEGLSINLDFLKGLAIPTAIVKTDVTLTAVEKAEWSQAGIGSDAKHIDVAKTYSAKDTLVVEHSFTINYKGGATKVISNIEPVNVDLLFAAEDETTKERNIKFFVSNKMYFIYGMFVKTYDLKIDTKSAISQEAVSIAAGGSHVFASEIPNTATGQNLIQHTVLSKNIYDKFVAANPDNASVAFANGSYTLTIKNAGVYTLALTGAGYDSIVYTITVA